ncbi:hypothetical protein CA85_46780 [Allorhodopirellula solitaria]|uniref:Uncharacterized protein n=1 Tax=Allorhodopirellula solitaria TaxID=2527987 RepID=A0A5C5WZH7_9BACT|nr:hypothetical protein CA85_46780 [Allorhodopirellula solitaria]
MPQHWCLLKQFPESEKSIYEFQQQWRIFEFQQFTQFE